LLAAVTVAGSCVLESRLARRVRQIAGPVQKPCPVTPHSIAVGPATFDQKAADLA
jgi:hypothetical protein